MRTAVAGNTAPSATSVTAIDASLAKVGGAFRVGPTLDRDLAGLWRTAGCCIGTVLGGAAVAQALRDRHLSTPQKAVAVAVAGTYAIAGTYAAARPSWLARMVANRPRRTLAACAVPLAATTLTGGRRTPLHTLAAATVGGSAVIYGRRTGARAAHIGACIWSAQAHASRPPQQAQHVDATWLYFVMPLSYLINAAVAATVAALAYNARSLDSTLRDLARESDAIRHSAQHIEAQLCMTWELLLETLAAEPAARSQTLRAIGRVQEARAAVRTTLNMPQPPPRNPRLEYIANALLASGISGRTRPRLPQRADAAAICSRQIAELSQVLPEAVSVVGPARPNADGDATGDDPAVSRAVIYGAERITLLSAAVSAALVNAVRHAPLLTRIGVSVSTIDDAVVLRVHNDGCDETLPAGAAIAGNGLATLGVEAGRQGAVLTHRRLPAGCFELSLLLPAHIAHRGAEALLAWDEIQVKVDALLAEAVGACGAMVAVGCLSRPPVTLTRSAASALVSLAMPLVEHVARRDGEPAHWPLALAAGVSAVHTDPHRGLLCGWSGAALARHAFHHPSSRTWLLLGANAAGITVAYRDTDRLHLVAQLATLACGVGAMLVFALPAIKRLRGHERDVVGALAAIEAVDRVAIELHSRHSSADALRDIAAQGTVDAGRAQRLAERAEAIQAITTPRSQSYQNMLAALVGDVATIIGRRIWPAPITVRIDDSALRAGDERGKLHRMTLRATAIAVADLIAREALSHRPVRYNGERPLRSLRLTVAAAAAGSENVAFTVDPVLPGPAGKARLEERVNDLGALVTGWTPDGRLTFTLYPDVA